MSKMLAESEAPTMVMRQFSTDEYHNLAGMLQPMPAAPGRHRDDVRAARNRGYRPRHAHGGAR